MNAAPVRLSSAGSAGEAQPRPAQPSSGLAAASGSPRPEPAPAPPPAVSAQHARAAAQEANRKLAEKASELTIEFDDDLGRMIFRLVDTRTREVVRQIPSEEVLAIARALATDASAGILLRADA